MVLILYSIFCIYILFRVINSPLFDWQGHVRKPPKNWTEEKGFRKRLQFLCSVDSRDLIPTPGNDIFFYLFQFIYKIILWPYTIIFAILTDVSSIVCNSMIYSTYRYGTIIYFLDYCVSFKKVLYFKEKRLWESYKKVFSKWGQFHLALFQCEIERC